MLGIDAYSGLIIQLEGQQPPHGGGFKFGEGMMKVGKA